MCLAAFIMPVMYYGFSRADVDLRHVQTRVIALPEVERDARLLCRGRLRDANVGPGVGGAAGGPVGWLVGIRVDCGGCRTHGWPGVGDRLRALVTSTALVRTARTV